MRTTKRALAGLWSTAPKTLVMLGFLVLCTLVWLFMLLGWRLAFWLVS